MLKKTKLQAELPGKSMYNLRRRSCCENFSPKDRCIGFRVISERVLGRIVDSRTALRWSVFGRASVPLPTVRGVRRVHCTTVAASSLA